MHLKPTVVLVDCCDLLNPRSVAARAMTSRCRDVNSSLLCVTLSGYSCFSGGRLLSETQCYVFARLKNGTVWYIRVLYNALVHSSVFATRHEATTTFISCSSNIVHSIVSIRVRTWDSWFGICSPMQNVFLEISTCFAPTIMVRYFKFTEKIKKMKILKFIT